jgi:hypothetical protein
MIPQNTLKTTKLWLAVFGIAVSFDDNYDRRDRSKRV